MAAPELCVPIAEGYEGALQARAPLLTGNVSWKLEIDDNFDDAYTDYTGYIDNNQVTVTAPEGSVFAAAGAVQVQIVLRNVLAGLEGGDLAECPAKLSVDVGGEGYIQIFQGYVRREGVARDKRTLTEDIVALVLVDASQYSGMERPADIAYYLDYDICDPVTPATSLAHALAEQLGYEAADVDFLEIAGTKDVLVVDGSRKVWEELQDLAMAYCGLLQIRYDGKPRLTTWSTEDWNAPAEEWVFAGANVHQVQELGPSTLCTRARTEYMDYQTLTPGAHIFTSYDDWDALLGQNAIEVAAGEYWPGGSDEYAVGKLTYQDGEEKYPLAADVITPNISTQNRKNYDIICSAPLTLESFNGTEGTNPAKTQQNPDSSEIILKNATGSTITITRFQLRGTPIRESTKVKISEVNPAVTDDWKHANKDIPGKYIKDQDAGALTCHRWVQFWGERPKQWEIVADFTPQLQRGAFVSFTAPDSNVYLCYVESYSHRSKGPHTLTRTTAVLVEHIELDETVDTQQFVEAPGKGWPFPAVRTEEEINGFIDLVNANGGGTVTLEAGGEYYISAPIVLKSNVILDGKGARVIKAANVVAITIEGTVDSYIENVIVRNLLIDSYNYWDYSVFVRYARNVQIAHVTELDCYIDGIGVTLSENVLVQNCTIATDTESLSNAVGIALDTVTGVRLISNDISGRGLVCGISVDDAQDTLLLGNDVHDGYAGNGNGITGISITQSAGRTHVRLSQNIVTRLTGQQYARGIHLGAGIVGVQGNVVEDVWQGGVWGNTYAAFRIAATADVAMDHNAGRNNGSMLNRGDCESLTPPAMRGELTNVTSNATFARSGDAYRGYFSFLFTKTVAAGTEAYVALQDNVLTNDMHGLEASTALTLRYYTLQAWIKIPAGGMTGDEVTLEIGTYYDSAWHWTTQAAAAIYDEYQFVEVTAVIPSTATAVIVRPHAASTAAIDETFRADELRLRIDGEYDNTHGQNFSNGANRVRMVANSWGSK